MSVSRNALKKLTKEELSNMVIEYQNKFDNILSNINTELTSLRDRSREMKSQVLLTRILVKQSRILARKCAANEHYSRQECLKISGIPDDISNNILEETALKVFNETAVTVQSKDVEACHCLNQKANAKKVIIEL